MFSVLHHIPNIYNVLKETYRVLNQYGALFIDHEPKDNKIIKRMLIFINKRLFHIVNYNDISKLDYSKTDIHAEKGFNRLKIKNILKNIGYKNVIIEYHNLLPYPPPLNINKKLYILIWILMDNVPIINILSDSINIKTFKL